MVWALSDLEATELGIFLFGDAYRAHWKEVEGWVFAILNATVLPAAEKGKFALRIKNGSEVVKLGKAVDFGICKGMTSAEARCKLAVNISKSHFCLHHIASKFMKAGKGRQQLNNALNFRKNLFLKGDTTKNLSAGVYTSPVPTGMKRKRMDSSSASSASAFGSNSSSRRGDLVHRNTGTFSTPMVLSTTGHVLHHQQQNDRNADLLRRMDASIQKQNQQNDRDPLKKLLLEGNLDGKQTRLGRGAKLV